MHQLHPYTQNRLALEEENLENGPVRQRNRSFSSIGSEDPNAPHNELQLLL